MTTAQPAPTPRAPHLERQHGTLSSEQYRRMIEESILTKEDRVELIQGEMLLMPPTGKDHTWGITRYTRMFLSRCRDNFTLQTQSTIHLDEGFSPEPDLALLKFRDDDYLHQDATAADVLLVIEIADSSVRYDLEIKTPLYARAGVPEVWILDLTEGTLHRFATPTAQGYQDHSTPEPGETLSPGLLPEVQLQLNALLPQNRPETP